MDIINNTLKTMNANVCWKKHTNLEVGQSEEGPIKRVVEEKEISFCNNLFAGSLYQLQNTNLFFWKISQNITSLTS